MSLVLSAVLATGCREEQIESLEVVPETITFNAVIGKQTTTRAKEFGYWQPGETLDVSSYMTGAGSASPIPFHLTYNGPYTTSWNYSPLIEVSNPPFSRTYYAYYPTAANVSNVRLDGNSGSFDYTVRLAPYQEDLVTAYTVTSLARVPLMFHHVLSQVNFAVQGIRGVHVNISNIRLDDIATTANYTFNATGGRWTTPTGNNSYAYTPPASVTFPTSGTSSDIIYLGNKGGNVPTENDNDNALMLMPQSFSTATGGSFRFDYALSDMNNQPMKSGSAKVFFGDFTTKTWEMGKRYLYLIDLTGLVEEGPITFEVIMFGWSDAIQNVAQPVVVADGNQLLIEKAISAHNTTKAQTSSLTVFPVSLPNNPMAGGPNDQIRLSNFAWGNFAPGDQVRILCFSNSDAMRIVLDPNNAAANAAWTLVPPTASGTEVVLIKK